MFEYTFYCIVHFIFQPYDYGSVMHYPKGAFSSNGLDTIVPNQSGVEMGQRDGMSDIDIAELNAIYE